MLINFVIKYAFMAWREHNSSATAKSTGTRVSVYPICMPMPCHFQYIYLRAHLYLHIFLASGHVDTCLKRK